MNSEQKKQKQDRKQEGRKWFYSCSLLLASCSLLLASCSLLRPPVIHRAEWIVPVCSPPVRNGGVLIHGGRIVAAGPFPAVRRDSPAGARLADHGQAALFPALVNAHTHLELSPLRGKIPFPQPGFRGWIGLLFPLRAAMGPHCADEGLRAGYAELFAGGTGLCGDITNGGAIVGPPAFSKLPERQVFLELLGFNLNSVAAAMPALPASGRAVEIDAYTFSSAPEAGGGSLPLSPTRSIPFRRQSSRNQKSGRGRAGFLFRFTRPNIPKKSNFCAAGKAFAASFSRCWDVGTPDGSPPEKPLLSTWTASARSIPALFSCTPCI